MNATTDASTGHVLSPQAPLVRNLAALWACDPALAAVIDALDDTPSYAVTGSKAGPPTVAVQTADGRNLFLHSKYQPLEEAQKLIAALDVANMATFYILGFGLGYHVEALFEKASDEAIFCVFEPDPILLRTAMEERDLTKFISSGRVMFFWRADKPELFQKLTPHSALISMGSQTLVHAPSLQINPEFYRQAQLWIGEFAAFCRTNINTLVINSKRTAENISRNIGWYVAAPGLERLRDRFRGFPGVIVSAGPSLRKNKHLLKGLRDNAVLIAVQTTLQPMLEMGVEPHFVTSLDYHDICARFFEKLPRGLTTELVAEPKATEAIFDLHPGALTVLGNEYAEALLWEMNLNKPTLTAGATVAHLAYYLAEHLGCDPIIFVGQDLGFSDGLCYAPGTSYEDVWRPEMNRYCTAEMKQWEQIVRDRYILRRTVDHEGRGMYTEERLFTYLQQFERDFAKSNARIIDATEGGALKRGTLPMKLADAIAQHCARPLEANLTDHAGLNWQRLGDAVDCLGKRRAEAAKIEQISRQTLPILEEIRDHLEEQGRVNRAIARVDDLRAKMNDLGRTYELVIQLTQKTELNRFESDRKLAAAKVDGIEKQRRQVDRDVANVKAIIEAAVEFQSMMTGIVSSMRQKTRRMGIADANSAQEAA